jgi:hypothetical protein
MTANQALAEQAHGIAVKAQGGTLTRKAWGCVSVALGTTGTIPAARLVLAVVRPPEVRDAALAVLDGLAGKTGGSAT